MLLLKLWLKNYCLYTTAECRDSDWCSWRHILSITVTFLSRTLWNSCQTSYSQKIYIIKIIGITLLVLVVDYKLQLYHIQGVKKKFNKKLIKHLFVFSGAYGRTLKFSLTCTPLLKFNFEYIFQFGCICYVNRVFLWQFHKMINRIFKW